LGKCHQSALGTEGVLMTEILFYMLAVGTIGCTMAALFMPQVMESVLFLIGAFFNVSGLFLLLGAEFLAFVLIILNVGAVALLFLFILMTLNVSITKGGFYKKPPMVIGGLLLIEMGVFLILKEHTVPVLVKTTQSNTHALGEVLYTHYIFPFQIMGVILLTAMIIAVGLLWEKGRRHKRQEHQSDVKASDRLTLTNPERGKGIKR
jgi:NADH-quinone oxidoreductase subunit J